MERSGARTAKIRKNCLVALKNFCHTSNVQRPMAKDNWKYANRKTFKAIPHGTLRMGAGKLAK